MHLIIAYAGAHTFSMTEALAGLPLPNLLALLGLLQRQQVLQDGSPTPLHLPHERLQAQALGWPHDALALPWAAWQQAQKGQASGAPQAWMTPCHWQIGMDQVVMTDPSHLHLSDEESQQLLQTMQPFLQEDGLQVTWHSALRWHLQGQMLAGVPTASLDRVIGQNVQHWMPEHPALRPLQRLQSEMQMLLYNHPVNDARDARRQYTVNAFWLHGAGTLPVGEAALAPPVTVSQALRTSALHGDVQAWRQAWQTLDATALADLLRHLKSTGKVTLSLCSEHVAHTYTARPRAWHRGITRLFQKTPATVALQALVTSP
jgi:hypothetical protein